MGRRVHRALAAVRACECFRAWDWPGSKANNPSSLNRGSTVQHPSSPRQTVCPVVQHPCGVRVVDEPGDLGTRLAVQHVLPAACSCQGPGPRGHQQNESHVTAQALPICHNLPVSTRHSAARPTAQPHDLLTMDKEGGCGGCKRENAQHEGGGGRGSHVKS